MKTTKTTETKAAKKTTGKKGTKGIDKQIGGASALAPEAILGSAVWWNIPRACLPFDTIHDKLRGAGFDPEHVIPMTPEGFMAERAFGEARRVCLESRSAEDTSTDSWKTKLIRRDDKVLVYSLLNITVDEAKTEAKGQQEIVLTVYKRPSEARIDSDKPHPIAKALAESFKKFYGSCTDQDIRSALLKLMREIKGFRLRPTGGIYFVGSEQLKILERFSEVFEWANVYTAPVARCDASASSIGGAASEDVWSRFSEFEREVEAWGKTTRLTTMKDRLETYQELAKLGEFYTMAFEAKMDGLDDKLAGLKVRVTDLISEKEGSLEEKVAAKKKTALTKKAERLAKKAAEAQAEADAASAEEEVEEDASAEG